MEEAIDMDLSLFPVLSHRGGSIVAYSALLEGGFVRLCSDVLECSLLCMGLLRLREANGEREGEDCWNLRSRDDVRLGNNGGWKVMGAVWNCGEPIDESWGENRGEVMSWGSIV